MGSALKLRSPAVLFVIGVVVTIVLAVAVVMTLLRTGDAKAVSDNAPLIAAVIALGGVGTAQMVSIALEDRRAEETRNIEERRTQEARELEAQRAHEAALQNYFEVVGGLLIEQPLRRASPGDNLSTVVRAQTLAVLEGLDPDRKRLLLLFLYESGLIYEQKLVVSLLLANLDEANLKGANLKGAYLQEVSLSRANLSRASLIKTNLSQADLSGADLSRTFMLKAYMLAANLNGADLTGARLSGANLDGADLTGARLNEADLSAANLSGAANLGAANLSGANLSGANLNRVDLSYVLGWTEDQLSEAKSLEGATMPDGQTLRSDWPQWFPVKETTRPTEPTFKDWIRGREGRKEDGENE
jgi:uncharacterized protein YjbI with pentapeptide repeats